jgi:hypothetical protein
MSLGLKPTYSCTKKQSYFIDTSSFFLSYLVAFFFVAMKLMFVGECEVEMLSGTSAIQKTVESLLAYSASPKFTSTSFKVTKQGITMTDNERK